MEVNGYIIPPPMESQQCIRILPPDDEHDDPRRCGGNVSGQELEQAKRLRFKLAGQKGEELASTMERIIRLRVCNNTHRKKLINASQLKLLESLVEAYKEMQVETEPSEPQLMLGEEELFERHPPPGPRRTIELILRRTINQRQDEEGMIYIFSWPRKPGLLKIGYAKESAEDRVRTLRHCHPEASLLYKMDVTFPERMEQLIHAELADKRYRLREDCLGCGKRHTEWFAVTLEEAKRVIRDWCGIAASPLYTEGRTLSPHWTHIIGKMPRVTALALSQCLEKMSSVRGDPDPLEISQRMLSQRQEFVLPPSSSLRTQEDEQVEGLAAKMNHDLSISSAVRRINIK